MAFSWHVHLVGNANQSKARGVFQSPASVAPSNPEANDRNRLRRLSRLPVLLAGPVVRRLERGRVWIWLATSIPVTVYAWVEDPSAPAMLHNELGNGRARSFRVGGRLHIVLVRIDATVTPPERRGQFPSETILTYNVRLSTVRDDWFFDGEVLLHPSDIVIGSYQAPTFFVPSPERSRVRFLHGSCRKLHGEGEDAISRALNVLQAAASQPQHRPTHLLLTGDQIYGDDVHTELIEQIRWLGLRLMARREYLPGLGQSTVLTEPGERGAIVTRGGFTAGDVARNHLLGLGEYAAMYLLAWSPEVWQQYGASSGLEDTSADMRRLLANIPTYMTFDDHEITDDWNLTYEWVFNVASNPTTRRVISNGLAMFGVFQAMGNNPRRANTLRRVAASNPVMATRQTAQTASDSAVQGTDVSRWPRFDRDTWGFLHWAFVAKMRPRVIFLDTRTHRVWERGWAPNRQRVAGLLAPYALERLRRHLRAVGGHVNEPVVIVFTSPSHWLRARGVSALEC
ncbi:hypothetical protein C2W62_04400 [Candidatus Entotheonella serta]|nr:hypothetical protein C2W62_04400 [Candidatus Entotheonella serta]